MLRVHGLDLSYFTGKLEAYLRAKGLPYELVPMDTRSFRRCARITGVAQMPQLEFPDGQWLTDSTRIIEHFETQAAGPAIYPEDPALCFIAHLLEDFGDEWLWRPAMHYRWSFAPDARLLSDKLARSMMRDVPLPLLLRRWLIGARQRRLFVNRYRAWCLQQLRKPYLALDSAARSRVDGWLHASSPALGDLAVGLLRSSPGPVARVIAAPTGTHPVNSQWK